MALVYAYNLTRSSKVLSKIDGTAIRVLLNPKAFLSELPVKRFYRYVLSHQPNFDDSG
jgi:UDP-glucose:glycoprotein glucosyltransferase